LDVLIAIIVGLCSLAVATVPTILIVRRSRVIEGHARAAEDHAETVTKTLGEKNGHGSVMDILNEQSRWNQHHDTRDDQRFERIERWERAASMAGVALVAVLLARRPR